MREVLRMKRVICMLLCLVSLVCVAMAEETGYSFDEKGFLTDCEDGAEYILEDDENGEIAQVRITLHRDDECVYFILCLAYNDNAEDYADLADSISKKLGFDKPSSYL